jgi:hypothetical protein
MDDITALDIETDTTPCCHLAQECCRSRGLDPARTSITAVAVSDANGDTVLDAAELGGEAALLEALERLLAGRTGTLATWNGAAFDLPFLADRFAAHGIATALRLTADPSIEMKYGALPGHTSAYRGTWGALEHLDVQFRYRSYAQRRSITWSLKPVARSLGFEPVEVDRTAMHLLSADEVAAYVASDSRLTRQLALVTPPTN